MRVPGQPEAVLVGLAVGVGSRAADVVSAAAAGVVRLGAVGLHFMVHTAAHLGSMGLGQLALQSATSSLGGVSRQRWAKGKHPHSNSPPPPTPSSTIVLTIPVHCF